MGKQINYYMEYESFLRLAEKALELGCEIIRREHADEIRRGFSPDLITPDLIFYYFRVPEAGDIAIGTDMNGKQYASSSSASGNCLIEAGFSSILHNEKRINSSRIYSSTGYYAEDQTTFIGRPDCVTKVYNALARYAKKLAPQTEITVKQISTQDETYLQEVECRYKKYITKYCLELQKKGYILG